MSVGGKLHHFGDTQRNIYSFIQYVILILKTCGGVANFKCYRFLETVSKNYTYTVLAVWKSASCQVGEITKPSVSPIILKAL